MNDTAAANGPGSAAASAGAGGAGQPDNRTIVDPNAGGSGAGATDWVAGLSQENRALVEAKKWGSSEDAIKSYRELEAHVGKALTVPGADAPAEDWDKLWSKLGRPEKPDGYQLKVDRTNLPAEFPYDENLAIEFRTMAHEAGLSPSQAQKLHDRFVAQQAKSFTGIGEAAAKREGDAHRELVGKWGDPATPAFKQNVELMSRAVAQLGISDSLKAAGLLAPDGAVRDAKLSFALAHIGKELYAEDTMATGAGGVLDNPFSAQSENLTKQGKLIREDPEKARALIRAAGLDPATYKL